jgi:hypothetical protein
VLLDGPYPGLLRVLFVSHLGGILVFLGWVVNTPENCIQLYQKSGTIPTVTHAARGKS